MCICFYVVLRRNSTTVAASTAGYGGGPYHGGGGWGGARNVHVQRAPIYTYIILIVPSDYDQSPSPQGCVKVRRQLQLVLKSRQSMFVIMAGQPTPSEIRF